MYGSSLAKFFAMWRRKTSNLQAADIRRLDIKKDLLFNELSQSVSINETLKDQDKMKNIFQMRCARCMTKDI